MLQDIRLAFRTLAKSPGFTLAAAGALALGIGANTAVFSLVNQLLLNPSGFRDPDRLAAVRVRYGKLGLDGISMSAPNFADVRDSRDVFEHAAVMRGGDFNYTGGGLPERLQGANVSVEWFDVFGARPRLGRAFLPEEDQPGANQVVVLSWAAWQRLFGGDPAVLGRAMELNLKPYRVVGIMGPEFRWPAQVDLWSPIALPPETFTEQYRFNENLFAAARLKPGVSLEQASAWVEVLAERVRNSGTRAGAYAKDSSWGMFALPLTDIVAGDAKKPMLVLMGAVAFVLLIACANIAGLMLARTSVRAREIAVRAALGAGRWRLLRQTVAESLLLAAAGAVAGLGLAWAGIRLLLAMAPQGAAAGLGARIDGGALLFTAAAAAASGLLSGLAPAWQISRLDPYGTLKGGGQGGTAGPSRQRLRAVLVVGETALALMLLVGAGLFLRSLARTQEIDPGFDPRGVMTATLSLPEAAYKEPEKRIAFYEALAGRLAAIPGVSAAGMVLPLPFGGSTSSGSFQVEGREAGPGDPGPHGHSRYVTPGYFEAMKIPLKAGRSFTVHDRRGGEPVYIIDENLARQYWPNQDPVGKRMRRGSAAPWATIVGVVGNVKHSDLAGDSDKGTYYAPMLQNPLPFASVVARTDGDPGRLSGGIREAVRAVDPNQPVHALESMEALVWNSLAPRRFVVRLLSFFAVAALFLAALGLYGVIGYSVARRTREIGIRMALGAERRSVLGLVVGQGLRLAAVGVALGLLGALAGARLIGSQLFEVRAFDPATFFSMAAVLLAAALLASWIPARRATRVDPLEALRHE